MAMTPYTGDPEVIAKLGTTPQERGLTPDQFKAKFDEGLKAFVEWFNATHKTEFDAHLAENVSHLKELVRDVSISGVQTIPLPFKPKSLTCIANIEQQKAFSIGFWAENNAQYVKSIRLDTPETYNNARIIYLRNTSGYILAKIQNVTETGFEINWDESTGITGSASVYILASTH